MSQKVLKIAVIEDVFSYKDYLGEDILEYSLTPFTAIDELKEALKAVNPDLVIIGETANPFNIASLLKDDYAVLLAVNTPNIHTWRKARSSGMRGILQKPVTYEKIALALKGSVPKIEGEQESNIIYIEEASNIKLPRIKVQKATPKPVKELPKIEEIRKEIRPLILKQSQEAGKTITYYTTKGGVGKTLLSINTAIFIKKKYPSRNIALLDFNLDFGGVANFLGIEPKITAMSWQRIPEDSLEKVEAEHYLIKHLTGVHVLPAPIPPIDEEVFTYRTVHKILSVLKKQFDYIVVDLGPTLRDITVVTLEHADEIFLLSTPSISSVKAIYDLVRIFEGLKINPDKIKLVLNLVKANTDFTDELKKYIPYSIIAKIPYIRQVEVMHDNYELVWDNNRFNVYLDGIVSKIIGSKEEKKSNLLNFLSKGGLKVEAASGENR